MKDKKYVEFPLPEGFSLPDGAKEGDEVEVLARVIVKEGGENMCLVSVDGSVVDKKKESTEDEVMEEAPAPEDAMFAEMIAADMK